MAAFCAAIAGPPSERVCVFGKDGVSVCMVKPIIGVPSHSVV